MTMHDPYQLIIPMTGLGQRFRDAGYLPLKPLIDTGFGSMISGVLRNYPSISSPICIISSNHEQREELRKEILHHRPRARIFEIPGHKFGPSFAVKQIQGELNLDELSVINYCDFSGIWSEAKMVKKARSFDGLILVYSGFHPHMLRSTNFAYIKTDSSGMVLDIREKQAFGAEPNKEYASSGTYVFRSGGVMLDAIDQQISMGISYAQEFYTSLTYLPMIKSGKEIGFMEIPFFFQWGTPENLQDFKVWSLASQPRRIVPSIDSNNQMDNSTTVILAAGVGSRLRSHGIVSKPLLPIFNKPLWSYSAQIGAKSRSKIIVALEKDQNHLEKNNEFGYRVLALKDSPKNALLTCDLALTTITPENESIHVMAADNIICGIRLADISNKLKTCDVLVWVARDYLGAKSQPESFSWVSQDSNEKVLTLHLKSTPPHHAHLLIGNFSFRNKIILQTLIQSALKNNSHNAELSFDLIIQEGLDKGLEIRTIDVGFFAAIGTEIELNIAEYYEHSLTRWNVIHEK